MYCKYFIWIQKIHQKDESYQKHEDLWPCKTMGVESMTGLLKKFIEMRVES